MLRRQACFVGHLGPIKHCLIVVPTRADSNKGQPHCLEVWSGEGARGDAGQHLIFMGCKKFPDRGHLDVSCTLCLGAGVEEARQSDGAGDGTNAWTDMDHTAYEVTVAGTAGVWREGEAERRAGEEGIAVMGPMLLEHVMHPLLKDDHFVTEVYHICGEGSEKGVVYSEMLVRLPGTMLLTCAGAPEHRGRPNGQHPSTSFVSWDVP